MILTKCRERRDELKMTLLELAGAAGCSIGTIQKAEKCKSINTNIAKGIAIGLRINLEQLI